MRTFPRHVCSPRVLASMLLATMALAGCGTTTPPPKGTTASVPQSTPTATVATTPAQTSTSSSPGDDYHIATFGHEASEPDRGEITRLVKRYYAAVRTDDGKTACALISPDLAKGVPDDYGRSPNPAYMRGTTCPRVLSGLFKHLRGPETPDPATTRVTGVRLMGRHGFAQLSSKTTPTAQIAVLREGSAWKIRVLIGRSCTDCSSSASR
jgi:hypothetical protein